MKLSEKLGAPWLSFLLDIQSPWLMMLAVFAFVIGVSIGVLAVLTVTIEARPFYLSQQHPALISGDILLAVFAATSAGLIRQLPAVHRVPPWGHMIALGLAIAIAIWFHFVNEAKVYTKAEMLSPTKLWHDFATIPVLGYFLLLLLFVLMRHFSQLANMKTLLAVLVFGLVCLGIWVYLSRFYTPTNDLKLHYEGKWQWSWPVWERTEPLQRTAD